MRNIPNKRGALSDNGVEGEEEDPEGSKVKRPRLKAKVNPEFQGSPPPAELEEPEELEIDTRFDPLKNSVILHNIFGFFDFETIKICRLVCPFWRGEATVFLRRNSIVRFSREQGRDMDRFVREAQDNPNLPLVYDHYYLETITSSFFFELCGERIRHLSLGIWTWRPDKYFTGKMAMKNLRKIIGVSCPNLESLTLRQSRNTPSSRKKTEENGFAMEPTNLRELRILNNSTCFFENQLGILLRACESLERLRVHFYQKQDIGKFLNILDSIVAEEREKPFPRLKCIRFTSNEFADISFTDTEFQRFGKLLVDLGVKLFSLQVPFLSKDIQVSTIEDLLRNQFATLQRFTSQQSTPEELPTIKLPCIMPKLVQVNACLLQISAKDFVRNSPVLTNVSADFSLSQFPLQPSNHLFLQELDFSKELRNPDIIWKVSKHFPYLRKMTLRKADGASLKTFFEAFSESQYFQELCITFGEEFSQAFAIESILTGFTTEKCAEILDWDHEEFYPSNEESLTRPSLGIGFLKRLKSLDLEYNGKPRCPQHRGFDWFSGISIFYGLAQLKNLKSLTLRQFLVSSRHLIVLPDQIPLNELTLLNCRVRNDCDDVTVKTIAHRFSQKFGNQIRFYQGGY